MAHGPNRSPRLEERQAGLLATATMVLWWACLAVGLIGLRLPPRQAVPAQPPPVDAELLSVETVSARPRVDASPPATPASSAQTPAPPDVTPVAAPSAAIAFAQPLDVAPRIAATQPSVIRLTFGEGEGQQPPPEYPPEAVRDGEEGTVTVRMTVGEDGRVSDAQASSPCPWPLLNNAAIRAVRHTWRFRKGPLRTYEVSIEFHLNRHE
jgi:TonB family protein